MTKEEFKRKWELDEGITFDDVADCAVEWNITATPRIHNINDILYLVLLAADTNDASVYKPSQEEE